MELFLSGLVIGFSFVLIAGLMAIPGLLFLLISGVRAIEDEQLSQAPSSG